MRYTELQKLDLNLLLPLQALLAERHLTRAGRTIGLSQPAMSRTLARLRSIFDDPLLVSTAEGLQLTSRALEIQRELGELLPRITQLVSTPNFEPARAKGEVRIAAPDIIVYKLIPAVLREMHLRAPQLTLHVEQWRADWRQQLETGDIDLTIGQPTGNEPGVYQHVLATTEWTCVLRQSHPCLEDEWTLERYAELSHLLVSVSGRGGGQVDDALAKLGLVRHVALRMPYTVLSPLIIAETDLVLTTSRWLAKKLADQTSLVLRKPPVELAPVALPMVWHERTHHDDRARFVRDLFIKAGKEIDPNMLRECV